tara:strand:+ start:920 stop:1387 length:468 start_codon:yes stop_codon:yes gene_type:complete
MSALNPYARTFTPRNRRTSVEKKIRFLIKQSDDLLKSQIAIKKLSVRMTFLLERTMTVAVKKMARIAGKRLSFLLFKWHDNMFWDKEFADLSDTESDVTHVLVDLSDTESDDEPNPFLLPAESDSDTDSDYELSDTQSEDELEFIDAPALLPDDY